MFEKLNKLKNTNSLSSVNFHYITRHFCASSTKLFTSTVRILKYCSEIVRLLLHCLLLDAG